MSKGTQRAGCARPLTPMKPEASGTRYRSELKLLFILAQTRSCYEVVACSDVL
jgi:hypothetical protein